jgi:hypothetical protein
MLREQTIMSFTVKIKRKLLALLAPKNHTARELYYLKLAYSKTERDINYYRSLPQPACCHECAYPFLIAWYDKQERRLLQIKRLEKRLTEGL